MFPLLQLRAYGDAQDAGGRVSAFVSREGAGLLELVERGGDDGFFDCFRGCADVYSGYEVGHSLTVMAR